MGSLTGPIQEETNLSRTLFRDPEIQQEAEQPLPAQDEQEDPSTNTQNQNMSATNTTSNLPTVFDNSGEMCISITM